MSASSILSSAWQKRVVVLSLLLLFFAIPHTLEDFALGEPANAGVPAPVLALVISGLIFFQALGLYWLGQGQRRGAMVQVGIGLFWPIASGVAQLPHIVTEPVYRSGPISILYVAGLIVVGTLLCFSSIWWLKGSSK